MTSFQVIQEGPDYPNQNSFYYRWWRWMVTASSAPTLQAAVDEQFIILRRSPSSRSAALQYQVELYTLSRIWNTVHRAHTYMTDVLSYLDLAPSDDD
jgi:hypothetical protein